MTSKPNKPGRPLGPVADAVLELLAAQSCTAREIAHQLQASMPMISVTCSRLLSKDRIRIVERLRVPGCNRPIYRYAIVKSVDSSKLKNIIWGL